MKRLTQNEFIKKANYIHNDKYIYDLVEYKNVKSKIDIQCAIHGKFQQRASHHLSGHGCRKCGSYKSWNGRRGTKEEFIDKSILVHGNLYDYSQVDYKGIDIAVEIKCLQHGIFLQSPYNHLNNAGCIKCKHSKLEGSWKFKNWEATSKKSKLFDGYKIYFAKLYNDSECFYKIGRTFLHIDKRLNRNIPYMYDIMDIWKYEDALYCCEEEKRLHNILKDLKYIPRIKFNGYNECYKLTYNEEKDVNVLTTLFNIKNLGSLIYPEGDDRPTKWLKDTLKKEENKNDD